MMNAYQNTLTSAMSHLLLILPLQLPQTPGNDFVLLWVLFKLAVLIKLLIQAKTIQKKRPKLLLSNAVRGPFSFINAIVFPTHLYQSEAYELMLTHEKIHVKQWHSLDILLTHIMFVVTWWNPFLWW